MDPARPSEVAVFRKYVQAFQTLKPRAVVPFFGQPALPITPMGPGWSWTSTFFVE